MCINSTLTTTLRGRHYYYLCITDEKLILQILSKWIWVTHVVGGNWPQDGRFPSLQCQQLQQISPVSTDKKWTIIRSTLYIIVSQKVQFFHYIVFCPVPLKCYKAENNVSSVIRNPGQKTFNICVNHCKQKKS